MNRCAKVIYRKRAKDLNEGIGNNPSIPASLQISYMDRLVAELNDKKFDMELKTKELVENAYADGSK